MGQGCSQSYHYLRRGRDDTTLGDEHQDAATAGMCGSKLQIGLKIHTQTKDTFLKLLLARIVTLTGLQEIIYLLFSTALDCRKCDFSLTNDYAIGIELKMAGDLCILSGKSSSDKSQWNTTGF